MRPPTPTRPTPGTMPFGMYKGRPIRTVPRNYLLWALREIKDIDPALREAFRRAADHDGSLAFLVGIHERPGERTHRLVFADWLDENGQPERAAVIRSPQSPEARIAYASRLDGSGYSVRLADFARLQVEIEHYRGTTGPGIQALINREYETLARCWRGWLPPSVTTLGQRADREAYCRDFSAPAITFPSRRRDYGADPWVSVLFRFGLPDWIECDARDWARCGLDMLEMFPWVGWHPQDVISSE